jgi:hypothetical protein
MVELDGGKTPPVLWIRCSESITLFYSLYIIILLLLFGTMHGAGRGALAPLANTHIGKLFVE